MATEVNEFVFDSLLPQEFPVKFGGDSYVLCEIDGETDIWYKETLVKVAKPDMETRKPTSTDGIARIDPDLVGRCLFRSPKKDGDKPVGSEFVLKLGARVIEKLASKIREMSGMNSGEDAAKNSPSAITPG